MGDTVDTIVNTDGPRNYGATFRNTSDGTGESTVVKVDASSLIGPDEVTEVDYFSIKSVQYDIQGFSSVDIIFDAATDDIALSLSGNGYLEFTQPVTDPKSTTYTGDISFTTNNAINGASYTIDLNLKKHI